MQSHKGLIRISSTLKGYFPKRIPIRPIFLTLNGFHRISYTEHHLIYYTPIVKERMLNVVKKYSVAGSKKNISLEQAKMSLQKRYMSELKVLVEENRVIIEKGTLRKPDEILCGHNDHRIVMSLTLLSTLIGGSVSGAQAVAKSYPDFFEKISSIGIDVNEIN